MSSLTETKFSSEEPNVGEQERKLSLLGGGLMILAGLRHLRSPLGWSALALGAGLVSRGATGKCAYYSGLGVNTHESEKEGFVARSVVTINRPVEDLYSYWRKLENLPKLMSHLESVTEIDAIHSHWVAMAPLGTSVSWDAIITRDVPNEAIHWEAMPGSTIRNAGHVTFVPLSHGRGTEVHAHLRYFPPAGAIGVGIAKLFGEDPQKQFADDLLRFKQFMETGENAVTAGQSANDSAKRRLKSKMVSSAIVKS
ncbi:MAG: DUF2892 domain-containing protein [Chthonomonadaceae bacterium]|nr:DUF2892 domain-containing protein [Chthonomonadaceae bacterium]